jgi:hypothetical protein
MAVSLAKQSQLADTTSLKPVTANVFGTMLVKCYEVKAVSNKSDTLKLCV